MLELTVGVAEENGEHKSLLPTSCSILTLSAFPSSSVHWCVFGPCKQTEHGLFTTAPEQNSSHLSQQRKPTGKRDELYLVYIVALFDWLTQIKLFFKDKSVSLRKNCAHAAKMKDEFIGRSLQKGRKLRASVCRGTLSKEHKFDFILLLFHLQTWTRSNLNRLHHYFGSAPKVSLLSYLKEM